MIPHLKGNEDSMDRFENGRRSEKEIWSEVSRELLQLMMSRVNTVLLGKAESVKLAFVALLAGGHVLLEDVPGVGKTLLARAIARVMGGEFRRIQFTSDLLPADVIGGLMWDAKQGDLVFRQGPLIANVVLADEINRTPPRTQSALLEAMEERSVTADGQTMRLPVPFMLLATQNPLQDEGTYPLPEAQLDRFLMRLSIGYPALADEVRMLGGIDEIRSEPEQLRPVIIPEEWLRMQRDTKLIHVHETLLEYAVQIVTATRRSNELMLGASPRASRDWVQAAKAMAYVDGRGFVIPDDLLATSETVLAHRLVMRDEGAIRSGDAADLLRRLSASVPLPSIASVGRR